MTSVSQWAEAIQTVFTTRAKELERQSGFVHRASAQWDGPSFAQTTVLGGMDEAQASYSQLQQVAASLGVPLSPQALEQRFGQACATFMQRLLQQALGQGISREVSVPELLGRFKGVYLQDGRLISLPAPLAQDRPGSWGNTPQAGQSSLRVQVRLELGQAGLRGPWLQAGRQAARSGPAVPRPLPKGGLYNVESGSFPWAQMRRHDQEGHFWLTQAQAQIKLSDQRGQCWDLLDFLQAPGTERIDVPVQGGVKEGLPRRLRAGRLPKEQVRQRRRRANQSWEGQPKGCRPPGKGRPSKHAQRKRWRTKRRVSPARQRLLEWRVLLTKVPAEMLSLEEALVLARWSFQIEGLWKLWKPHGQLDPWRSLKPQRVLTELVAKLIGLVITPWNGCSNGR